MLSSAKRLQSQAAGRGEPAFTGLEWDGVGPGRLTLRGIATMPVDTRKGGFQVAQKITTLFIDDIDGGVAEGTVRFALDGTDYEIDLNAEHSEELRSALGRYVNHARKVSGTARRGGRAAGRGVRGTGSTLNTTEIRSWARENGYDIKDRGRVPTDVVAKYQAATGK
ncbi:MAG: histone-like nucleoid-structuring protein Lsr2 [Trebonia sp.]